jgi:phosphatidylglycerol:prolipoprotein diacylglycerol transferase
MLPYLYDFTLQGHRVSLSTYSVMGLLGVVLAGGIYFWLVPDARKRPVAHLLFLGVLIFISAAASRLTQMLLDLRLAVVSDIPVSQLFSQSGSNIIGGISVGSLILLLWIWRDPHRIMTWKSLDALAVAFPFGHMLGRIGCLAAGCCFGIVADHEHALTVTYPDTWIVAEMAGTPIVHGPRIAAPLIAAMGLFAVGTVLLLIFRRTKTRGQVAPLYFILYGVFRSLHDTIRGDISLKGVWGPLTTGQIFGIIAVLAGVVFLALYFVRRRRGDAGEPFLPLNGKPRMESDAFGIDASEPDPSVQPQDG